MTNKLVNAFKDIIAAIQNWRIWLLLGWQDIRLRYRRSYLGPFWITISMAINIYTIGFLYGHLFRQNLANYFPFLAAGMLTWSLISTTIIESTGAFIDSSGYLKQIKLPYSIFIFRVLARNFIIFFHNIVVIVPIVIFFQIPISWSLFAIIIGLLFIALNGFFYGITLALLGARFRDINQLIVSVMQVIFFLTPIMWSPQALPAKYQIVAQLNPFALFIELIRNPLMGEWPSSYAYVVVSFITLFGIILMFTLLQKTRHRIIYWL